ncbi:Ribosomal RNA-processing protein 7 like A [Dissostichus eleginoides]|uniref:Ribosomal RNA-processing protein 7 like A n=1 Tax=Dissostichus eleginoides TaxID=100907 RepID=A0AAD9B5R8_DISEL|nr:Ribosomal RNA-processing protein 7 like A [Dissostichus eleginoides]
MAPSKKKHASNQACVIPGGFTVLSVQFNSDSVAQHKLYVKEHKVRSERSSHRPMDRTLFVLNIPPYCSEDVAKQMFSQFGSVQSVELRDHPGSSQDSGPKMSKFFRPAAKQGFKVGYVVFENSSSIAAAKSHPHNVPLLVCTEEQWIQQYTESFIHTDNLQKIVDSFMEGYDKRKKEHRNTQKEHIAELRKKFEEDKQRIALLRAQRKFKPY